MLIAFDIDISMPSLPLRTIINLYCSFALGYGHYVQQVDHLLTQYYHLHRF